LDENEERKMDCGRKFTDAESDDKSMAHRGKEIVKKP